MTGTPEHSRPPDLRAADLRAALRAFDGVHVDPLRVVAAGMQPNGAMVRELLGLLPSPEDSVELGATWLVKNLVGRIEEPLPARRTTTLVRRLADCRLDASRLHLLQALPRTHIGPAGRRHLEPLLRRWLDEIDHGFTRAWVYNALVLIAGRSVAVRRDLLETFAAAYDNERPAVRARLRRLIMELERGI